MRSIDDFHLRATAPVVGHHRKSKSLAAFDPLHKVSDPLSLSQDEKSAPPEDDNGDPIPKAVSEQDLRNELRAIASELNKQTQTSTSQSIEPEEQYKEEKKDEDSIIPESPNPRHRRILSFGSRRLVSESPAASPGGTKGIRWLGSRPASAIKESRHNRTKSMPGNQGMNSKKSPPRSAKKSTPAHSRTSTETTLSSDMLQELWELQEQAGLHLSSVHPGGDLAIPSLAKPRPTSFLTGKEVVLSSEADASEWQLEIPAKTEFKYTSRACQFMENCRVEKEVLDLNNLVGCSSSDLTQFVCGTKTPATSKLSDSQTAIVESLLECGTDLVQVQGYIRSQPVNGESNFREIFIVERQRQFLCVFRGTDSEQLGKMERQPENFKLYENKNVSVFADRYKAYQELEQQLFGKLDQLMEDNPFCDFEFAGHGFGGAMAILAAYRYAWARPELRVAALVTGNVKVGLSDFRLSSNSLPNLKIVRLDLGQARTSSSGVHVGHTIRINPGKSNAQTMAFKFSDDCKSEPSPIRKLRLNGVKPKGVISYVDALDDLGENWVKDFYREDGAGVKGKDNETRLVV